MHIIQQREKGLMPRPTDCVQILTFKVSSILTETTITDYIQAGFLHFLKCWKCDSFIFYIIHVS